MNVHRIRRVAEVLVVSQLRSGRSTSNPKSLFGRPFAIGLVDAGAFLVALVLGEAGVRSLGLSASALGTLASDALPFVPLVAVAAVLVAGVMFELTNTARFSGSDAANWLPLSPAEYVAASSAAIAFSYSPAIALFLGGVLPIALAAGLFPAYLVCAALSVVSLFEGGVLVEMVRAITQRSGGPSPTRRGHLSLLLRAALLIVLILAVDLAFNPVFLLAFLERFSSYVTVTTFVPFFWSTRAVSAWVAGAGLVGGAFAVGEVAFVGLLVVLAGELRDRYWVPTASEVEVSAPVSKRGHPVLALLGLSPAERAIVSKDLRGFVRRREMLPTLTVPVVLIVLLLVEGAAFGGFGSILWAGWVAGFFALLLAVTSVGQERRSFQSFYAYPIAPRSVLRAKAAAVLIPSLLGAVALGVVVGLVFGFPAYAVAAVVALNAVGAVLLALWGLVFASRYSDFQDRPRPQYLRPGAMVGAMLSGIAVLMTFLVPGAFALLGPAGADRFALLGWTVGFGLVAAGVALRGASTGFDRLFREVPY